MGGTQQSTRRKAQHRAHYDLSNEFFKLFLDPTMTYSSGLFVDAETLESATAGDNRLDLFERLELASIEKIDRACRTLGLRPGDRLVEIGTGWGRLRSMRHGTTAAR
ncbi:MAG: class I SAM-dependent methyltransferase [Planctomycetaceae bacterium]